MKKAAVHLGGVVELAGNAVEVAGEHPDGEREGEGQVREDQPAAGSDELDPERRVDIDEDDEQRQEEEHAREHLRRQDRRGPSSLNISPITRSLRR